MAFAKESDTVAYPGVFKMKVMNYDATTEKTTTSTTNFTGLPAINVEGGSLELERRAKVATNLGEAIGDILKVDSYFTGYAPSIDLT